MKYIRHLIVEFLKQQHERRVWQKIVGVMAAVVVFCTTYALILPAITLENELICENSDESHVHTDACYAIEKETAATEEKQRIYSYEDEEITVKVTLPLDNGVPEDAVLVVCPILDSDEEYENLTEKAEETIDGQTGDIMLYDISFYTVDNEYIPVTDEAMVSFVFKEAMISQNGEELAVLHYEETGIAPVQIENVVVETDENDIMTSVAFQTEGFSIFAMVKIVPADLVSLTRLTEITDETVANLDGRQYAIVSNRSKAEYAMMGTANYADDVPGRRKSYTWTNGGSMTAYTFWEFTKAEDGYKIHVGEQYLFMDSKGDLTITDEAKATIFSITAGTGDYEDSVQITGNGYHINIYQGENKGFNGYNEDQDIGNWLQLWYYELPENNAANLDGRSFAIVNYGSGTSAAVIAAETKDNDGSQTILKANPVSVTSISEKYYFESDEEVTIWIFEATEEDGVYYIKDSDSGKYMLIGPEDGSAANAEYQVILSDTPQPITVYGVESTGKVYLANANGVALNLFGGNVSRGFGGYKPSSESFNLVLCEEVPGYPLVYDLNLSDINSKHVAALDDSKWEGDKMPYLVSAEQEIGTDGDNLYTVSGYRNAEGYFVHCANMASSSNVNAYTVDNVQKFLKDQNESYGKEFLFEGWEATVDGTTYLFPENAEAVKVDNGIQITDTNGNNVVVPEGTVLTGKWKEISDTVLFFVNYSGTILDVENDVSGRNQWEFTPCVGIGRVYYGEMAVGKDEFFASDANVDITSLFTNEYDPDNPATQIVMRYIAIGTSTTADGTVTKTYRFNEPANGINNNELVTAVLNYIKGYQATIKISSAEVNSDGTRNNPTIDPDNADSDHYEVRWYVLKEQQDAWHIDGVLVAKTSEIAVQKNFSGLTEAQAAEVMDDLKIATKLGPKSEDFVTIRKLGIVEETDENGNTTTIDENELYEGQYEYHGKTEGLNSYSWTFHTILDEKYVMEETDYDYTDKDGVTYDCSTIVVVRTKDGKYHEAYGVTSTESTNTTDSNTQKVTSYLIGGDAVSVSFNNYYTKPGTGLLNLVKRDGDIDLNDPSGKLSGAEFALYMITDGVVGESAVQTAVSNKNGSVLFSNLEVGEYVLKETAAPTGYIPSDDMYWHVYVTKETITDENNATEEKVSVSITEYKYDSASKAYIAGTPVLCYDKGEICDVYPVMNSPNDGTVIISKTFENLTEAAMEEIRANTEQPYTITMTGKDSSDQDVTYTFTLGKADTVSLDKKTYTWRLSNVYAGTYAITESNFKHISAKDTIVNTNSPPVTIDYNAETAKFSVSVVAKQSSVVQITNKYTDEFTLKILKTDENGTTLLSDAVFDVYGAFAEATNTSKTINYKDPETGSVKKAYYYGALTTGDDGTGTLEGLLLSSDSEQKTYVIKEVTAPGGYALLNEPIVIQNVGPGNIAIVNGVKVPDAYDNGIFEIDIKNTKKADAKVDVTVEKKWIGISDTGPEIDLKLYRTINGTTFTLVTGSDISLGGDGAVPWQYEWNDLPGYDDDGNEYTYYVQEVPEDGYATAYKGESITFPYEGSTIYAGKATWNVASSKYEVTVTNTSAYELPESGGSGTWWYTIGGLAMMLAATYVYKRKQTEKRCMNSG